MEKLDSFEELNCWKACREVVRWVQQCIYLNKAIKDYDLKQNMIRAARSTTRNIAEGFGRHHHKENLQFCRISRGSLFELQDDLISALDMGFIELKEYNHINSQVLNAIRILNGYIRYLKSRVR